MQNYKEKNLIMKFVHYFSSYRSDPPVHVIWISKDVGKFTIVTSVVMFAIIFQ